MTKNDESIPMSSRASAEAAARLCRSILDEIEKAVIGKRPFLERLLGAAIAGGHVLVEDNPGLAKTLAARSLARVVGGSFKRIQFTPDLLPADITGAYVLDRKSGDLRLLEGPVFANFVLADEINRAPPKTQSALLEAMEERQATLEGRTLPLPSPFMVAATQNPIEYEGTFPLPEAQLDRFMLRISIGYPNKTDEQKILDAQQFRHPIQEIEQVVTVNELVQAQEQVKEVYVDDLIKEYIISLVNMTRDHPDAYLGASPRGSLTLYRTAQVRAAMHGRDYVIPDDVKLLASAALAHRLIVSPSARIKDVDPRSIVDDVLQSTPVPGARAWDRGRA